MLGSILGIGYCLLNMLSNISGALIKLLSIEYVEHINTNQLKRLVLLALFYQMTNQNAKFKPFISKPKPTMVGR